MEVVSIFKLLLPTSLPASTTELDTFTPFLSFIKSSALSISLTFIIPFDFALFKIACKELSFTRELLFSFIFPYLPSIIEIKRVLSFLTKSCLPKYARATK